VKSLQALGEALAGRIIRLSAKSCCPSPPDVLAAFRVW
jgi:hypothetical protein